VRSTDRDALVHDVCAVIDGLRDELVESLAEAIRIPSVTPTYPGVDYDEHVGGEARVSRLVEGLLASAGADTELFGEIDGRENCVGVVRGTGGGRSLILNGHVDVVPGGAPDEWRHGDAFSGVVEDGRVWGRGACDMKGGLLTQVFAAIALRRSGIALAGDLTLEAVVGEECMEHELGTSACVERGYRADAALVAEPSAPPVPLGVVAITPGVTRFIVTIEGRRTHPAMRGMTIHPGADALSIGVNAVDKAFLIYQAMRQREEEWGLTKRHPLFAPGQFVIHPGVVVASPRGQLDPFFIADHATLDYIVIHHPDEAIEDVRSEIEDVVATVAHLDGWLRDHPPAVEWKHYWPPSRVAPDHPIVAATCRAHELALGEPAQVVGWSAVHDGTFLNQARIPAISYGPGDVRQAHAVDEHIEVAELVRACKTYALLAIEWCGLS
jgi:acetylornithine deacetylase/succinyl-diaminopimelate desuccinylase family protein